MRKVKVDENIYAFIEMYGKGKLVTKAVFFYNKKSVIIKNGIKYRKNER